jgi:hypothetical protein
LEVLATEGVVLFYVRLVYICYRPLPYVIAIWFIFWLSGVFLSVLACRSKKNLATLLRRTIPGNSVQTENQVLPYFEHLSEQLKTKNA